MNWQNIEVVDKFNFLGVPLESTGDCNGGKKMSKTEGYRAAIPTDKCTTVTLSAKVQMLGSVYEVVCEAKIMYGTEV